MYVETIQCKYHWLIEFVYLQVTTYANYDIEIIIMEVQCEVALCIHGWLTHYPCLYYSSMLSSGEGIIIANQL